MSVGRVKWYDKSKGYGFIESPDGDVFFHFSDILMGGFKALAEDQQVSYTRVRREHGLKARWIRPLDSLARARHTSRYRDIVHMRIKEGKEKEFDSFFLDVPAWLHSMEQDLAIRRIGTWRTGQDAVILIESDRPHEQSMQAAQRLPSWENYAKRQQAIRELLEADEIIMSPIGADVPEEETSDFDTKTDPEASQQ